MFTSAIAQTTATEPTSPPPVEPSAGLGVTEWVLGAFIIIVAVFIVAYLWRHRRSIRGK